MTALSLTVLSQDEIKRLHEKTLELFQNVGIKITHEETLRRFKSAGANVVDVSGLVKLPKKLVTELLALAAPIAYETGLNGQRMEVGKDNRFYMSLILDPIIVDYEKGPRLPVLEDVRRHTIIGESLDRVSGMTRMQYPVSDVPEPDCYYKTMEVFLSHTTKHISIYPTSKENCREWMDVFEVIADAAGLDGKTTPLMSVAMALTSPLQVHGENIEIMKMAMQRCYPIIPTVCPMTGTTSPYSKAGTLLLANAILPAIITQLYKPGHPASYAIGPSVTDMKTGRDIYYHSSKMLFKIAAGQMARFYNLPATGEAGGTLTHRYDPQNGAEGFAYLLAAHSGKQNIIGGLGSMCNANGMSAEQIIMQCGLVDMVEYLVKGIDLSDSPLGLETFDRVGPGGNFLMDDHTLKFLRGDEFLFSPLLDLSGGYEKDAPGMLDIAHEKVNQLVSAYKPTVPEKVRLAVKKFFKFRYQNPKVTDL